MKTIFDVYRIEDFSLKVYALMKRNKLYYLFHPSEVIHALRLKFSDKYAITCSFPNFLGYEMDWENPTTFSQKLQWLKIHDRKPIYTIMADKYESKNFVVDRIGEEYIIPTLGVWNHFDEIDFDKLPNQFVLKCTHDSGSIALCEDKSTFDYASAKEILEKGLKRDFYQMSREWPYKNVPRRIIAEEYMKDGDNASLTDYKFYCFNGEPKFLYVSYGLADHGTAFINYVTLDWKQAPFHRPDFKELGDLPPKPKNFDLMMELSRKLSDGVPFLRVDFYEINQKVYYSELTFFPGGGMTPFEPREWDKKCGDLLTLPNK